MWAGKRAAKNVLITSGYSHGLKFKGLGGNMFIRFDVIFAPVERLLFLTSCPLHFAHFVSGSPQTPGCVLAQGPCEVKL